jgi:hypothetical protein
MFTFARVGGDDGVGKRGGGRLRVAAPTQTPERFANFFTQAGHNTPGYLLIWISVELSLDCRARDGGWIAA